MMLRVLLVFVFLWLASGTAFAGTLHSEDWYNRLWCGLQENGRAEEVLVDRSRADCVTGQYVIETKFAPDFKHAIGQALHYSVVTGKQAGILLIIETPEHEKYYKALMRDLAGITPAIRVWTLRVK